MITIELLSVKNLKVEIKTENGVINPVSDVSFTLEKGKTIGIVGESGSGKSVTALSMLKLFPKNISEIVDGSITFNNQDLTSLNNKQMQKIRGNRISMIFQEPMTSLNPVYTIGNQLLEPLMTHQKLTKKEAINKAISLLKDVHIPEPEKRLNQYPHELSGGMRQRVMIAMALGCEPELLIADEPTTALDVTVQAQILELIKELSETKGMSVILITHDLGVVSEMCDNVIVMYAGQIVEAGSVYTIFENPKHPYTSSLIKCIPTLETEEEELFVIEGNVPSLLDMSKGCRFQNRCPFKTKECENEPVELIEVAKDHYSRCIHVNELLLEGVI